MIFMLLQTVNLNNCHLIAYFRCMTNQHSHPTRRYYSPLHWFLSFALLGSVFLCGCGGGEKGPEKYHVSGLVAYNGKPINAGEVIFIPNNALGTTGPVGRAQIVDGKYDTRLKGNAPAIAGHLIVEVTGYAPPDPQAETTKLLFENYKMEIEMPAESKVLNIDVPLGKK